ncbi:MAG TPA: hypothetical protein VFF69_05680 [Phycisphaerales bacterium]|nr:hypothetical protein [Phycisphaerales bacterium]
MCSLLIAGPGFAQAQQGTATLPPQAWEAKADFLPDSGPDEPIAADPALPATEDWQLAIPAIGPSDSAATPTAKELERMLAEVWMLTVPGAATAPQPGLDDPISPFDAFAERAALDPLRARTDRWTTGLFSRDAELLTPLAPGRELLSWELTDRLKLSGVGGSRVWDYREREFVVSAEAGWQLSARAGLHLGYEVLQASSASMSPDVSGESIFARFQLRF